MKTKKLKEILMSKYKVRKITGKDYLSTGSTLINLACTGKPNRGFLKGCFYGMVGDSASGKTFLSLTCLAEASFNPNFDDYRFIYDNSENGALMDIKRFFGKRVSDIMEPPAYTKTHPQEPIYSSTIEEFYYHLDDAVKQGKPFIYILDSMDSLSSKDELEKFDEQKTAYRKGKQVAGSYGDGKAKKNSENLRKVIYKIKRSNSIVIIIRQTRDNLGFGFNKKISSGGHSLKFYATLELWSSIKKKLHTLVKGKPRQTGILCQIQVKKNRIDGKERTVTVPIYHSYGFDDVGSMVDYLLEEGHWNKQGKEINAVEFSLKSSREKLINHIIDNDLTADLKSIVAGVWDEIEKACEIKRKPRYE
jgi:RecA/RadA recombinase